MATATASIAGPLNPPQYDLGTSCIDYFYTVSFSAATDTYATGGITFDLTKAAANWNSATGLPSLLTVWVYTDTSTNSYSYIRGTTIANGKLVIYEANVQKTNATALNAGGNEFADVIKVMATFVRR